MVGAGRSGGAKNQGTLEPLEAGRGDRQDTPLNPSLGEKSFLLFEATRFVTICYGSHRISARLPCTVLGQERKRHHRVKPVSSPCCVEASGLRVHMEQGHSHPPARFGEG